MFTKKITKICSKFLIKNLGFFFSIFFFKIFDQKFKFKILQIFLKPRQFWFRKF